MAADPYSISLTPDQFQLLTELSVRTGKSRQQILVEAIERLQPQALSADSGSEQPESVLDNLVRHGLLGCIEGGPNDLATNPKYMEGFGEGDYRDY
jgi:hypothetical protein